MSKIKLFLQLSGFPEITRIINTDEFVGIYQDLSLGNGGSWCRMDTSSFSRYYKYVTVKENGKQSMSWSPDDEELKQIQKDFKKNDENVKRIGNKIRFIKIYGKKDDTTSNQKGIREDIRKIITALRCVVCGNSQVEVDHKNGLYNDKRVLKTSTQTLDDFQALCRHCNQQKRQSLVLTKQTGKRYSALSIPQLEIWGVDFWKGDETYDKNDPDTMVGTYWYDPVVFMQKIKEKQTK